MARLFILIALICVTSATARSFSRKRKLGSDRGSSGGIEWPSKLCDNETLAQSFLTAVRQLITTLETNGSYTQVLEKHTNETTYIEDDTNAALLSSNCTEYFKGLNDARKVDRQSEEEQQKYEDNSNRLFTQILQSLLGVHKFSDDDF